MRLTYTGLLNDFSANTGLTLPLSTVDQTFFNQRLQTRYQDALSAFSNWKNQQLQTTTTVVDQQYYTYPPGAFTVESATLTQGTIVYPIRVVNSQSEWDYINQYPNTNTIIPQFVFPRQYDFGVWPVPSQATTLTLNFIYSTPPLNQADYTTGTVSVTNASQTVTSAGGANFTSAMVGRYFVLTDSSGFPIDYWYKITGVNDVAETLTLQTYYDGSTASGQNYIIGQSPELPDEAHIFLSWGVTADWFASRGDLTKSTQFNNMYWTGDPNNPNRKGNILGGIIGLRDRYAERADRRIVTLNTKGHSNYYINWTNSILPS